MLAQSLISDLASLTLLRQLKPRNNKYCCNGSSAKIVIGIVFFLQGWFLGYGTEIKNFSC